MARKFAELVETLASKLDEPLKITPMRRGNIPMTLPMKGGQGRPLVNLRSIAIALAATLFAASAGASTLQISDAQTVQSLRKKLYMANVDVTQTIQQAREMKLYAIFDCLALIHDQGQGVGDTAAAIGDLMALSILMKDRDDELLVLRSLQTWLTVLTTELPHARQIINGEMVVCSTSATVNAKGQALLNVLSEWNDPVASILRRVNQAVPPRR